MHLMQKSILQLFKEQKTMPLNLRGIWRQIGEEHPQKVKYHLYQLQENWYITIDETNKEIHSKDSDERKWSLVSLPLMGQADCGAAKSFVEGVFEWYLRISRNLLPVQEINELFVLKAKWDSMNRCDVLGRNIQSGDYVIVQQTKDQPDNGDIVVSIIDERANIKRYYEQDWEIMLLSESTEDFPPILVDSSEWSDYRAVWKVIKVIKNPSFA